MSIHYRFEIMTFDGKHFTRCRWYGDANSLQSLASRCVFIFSIFCSKLYCYKFHSYRLWSNISSPHRSTVESNLTISDKTFVLSNICRNRKYIFLRIRACGCECEWKRISSALESLISRKRKGAEHREWKAPIGAQIGKLLALRKTKRE